MTKNVTIKEACAILEGLDFVHIYTHVHPDGDALGSAYALRAIMRKMGKRAEVICLDTLPEYLKYIWDVPRDDFPEGAVVTVDVADTTLLGEGFDKDKEITLAIDHHSVNRVDAQNLLCHSDMAATGEIIFEIARELLLELDEYIAGCLYTAIATDTGCFKFSNTTEHTFLVASQLTKYAPCGNFGYLNEPLFITKPIEKMKFESYLISNLSFYFGSRVSVSVVTNDIIKSFGLTDADTGGVEQLGKSPRGVLLAITLKERDGGFKVSMRSSDSINCADICAEFGGGGHRCAAGCFFEGKAESIVNTLISYIEEKGIL